MNVAKCYKQVSAYSMPQKNYLFWKSALWLKTYLLIDLTEVTNERLKQTVHC